MLSIITRKEAASKCNTIFRDIDNVKLLWTDYEDTYYIVNLLKNSKNILEIGTHRGFTTNNIAVNTEGRITTVDICKDMELHLKFQNNEILSREEVGNAITAQNVNSVIEHSDIFFARYIKEGLKFDGIFIDGDHSYEQVKKDTENALKCCTPGGIIVWHDVYNKEGADVKTMAQPNNMGVNQVLEELDIEVFKIEKSWVGFTICQQNIN